MECRPRERSVNWCTLNDTIPSCDKNGLLLAWESSPNNRESSCRVAARSIQTQSDKIALRLQNGNWTWATTHQSPTWTRCSYQSSAHCHAITFCIFEERFPRHMSIFSKCMNVFMYSAMSKVANLVFHVNPTVIRYFSILSFFSLFLKIFERCMNDLSSICKAKLLFWIISRSVMRLNCELILHV